MDPGGPTPEPWSPAGRGALPGALRHPVAAVRVTDPPGSKDVPWRTRLDRDVVAFPRRLDPSEHAGAARMTEHESSAEDVEPPVGYVALGSD